MEIFRKRHIRLVAYTLVVLFFTFFVWWLIGWLAHDYGWIKGASRSAVAAFVIVICYASVGAIQWLHCDVFYRYRL